MILVLSFIVVMYRCPHTYLEFHDNMNEIKKKKKQKIAKKDLMFYRIKQQKFNNYIFFNTDKWK